MLADIETLAGKEGWVGAGLLGVVLLWVAWKLIPDKDRQMENLLKVKNEHVERLLAVLETERDKAAADRAQVYDLVAKVSADSKENIKAVLDHCDREIDKFVTLRGKEPDADG